MVCVNPPLGVSGDLNMQSVLMMENVLHSERAIELVVDCIKFMHFSVCRPKVNDLGLYTEVSAEKLQA
jgi:hypothetical protein